MSQVSPQVLLLCYGNPGRLDDGLGAAFAKAFEESALPGVTVEADYQLTVEDAPSIAEHSVVIFVDAAVQGGEPFFCRPVNPKPTISFSSHSVDPENLLALAQKMFGAHAKAYAVGIRGYQFDDFGESLSPKAEENLAAAVRFLAPVLQRDSAIEIAAALDALDGQGADIGV